MEESEQKQQDILIAEIFYKTIDLFTKVMQNVYSELVKQTNILQEIKMGLERDRNKQLFKPPQNLLNK
jgi:hypothetical protein